MNEIRLYENRRMLFEDEYFIITRDDALREHNKRIITRYDQINNVSYRPQKIYWATSFAKFILGLLLDITGNPVSGVVGRIEIQFKNGEKRIIETDKADKMTVNKVIDLLNQRKK